MKFSRFDVGGRRYWDVCNNVAFYYNNFRDKMYVGIIIDGKDAVIGTFSPNSLTKQEIKQKIRDYIFESKIVCSIGILCTIEFVFAYIFSGATL